MNRPPAWPVFAAYVAAFALCLSGGQELVLVVARSRAAGDATRVAGEVSRFALSAAGLCSVALLDAAVLLCVSLAMVMRTSGARVAPPLSLGRSRATPRALAASAAGVTGLSLACSAGAERLGLGQGPVMRAIEDALSSSPSPGGFAVALLALAVAPGIAEETFFRGLLQTRLAAAWGRGPAIVAGAACFGALHLDLVQGVLAFVVGLLLGWIASRFDGIRPAILAHVTNNVLFVTLAHFRLAGAAPGGSLATLLAGGAIAVASIVVLRSPGAVRASRPAS